MATNSPERQAPKPNRSIIQWLLDSDPSIRWQVMRDLINAPAEEVAAERAKIATEGWGAISAIFMPNWEQKVGHRLSRSAKS